MEDHPVLCLFLLKTQRGGDQPLAITSILAVSAAGAVVVGGGCITGATMPYAFSESSLDVGAGGGTTGAATDDGTTVPYRSSP